MRNFTRRQAIIRIVGTGMAATVPGLVAGASDSGVVQSAVERISSVLESRTNAALIGMKYLRKNPSENNVSILSESLDFIASSELVAVDDIELVRLYTERVSRDFEWGNVVDLEGWVLSKTEARVFALLALS